MKYAHLIFSLLLTCATLQAATYSSQWTNANGVLQPNGVAPNTNAIFIGPVGEIAIGPNSTIIFGTNGNRFISTISDYAFSSALATNNVLVGGIGSRLYELSTLISGNVIYSLADAALQNSYLNNSTEIFPIGAFPITQSSIAGGGWFFALGDTGMSSSVFTNCFDLFAIGDSPLRSANLKDSDEIYSMGFSALRSVILRSSSDIYAWGKDSGRSALLTNSSSLYFYGGAGQNLAGSYTNKMWFGKDTNTEAYFSGSLTTAAPTGGNPATNKLGAIETGLTLTFNSTNAARMEINGRKVWVLIANETPP